MWMQDQWQRVQLAVGPRRFRRSVRTIPVFHWRRVRLTLAGVGIATVMLALLMVFKDLWFPRAPVSTRSSTIWWAMGPLLLYYGLLVIGPTIAAVADWVVARRMRRRSRESGYRHCGHCLHDLRGLGSGGACPECGRAFEMDELRRAWMGVDGSRGRRALREMGREAGEA